jgi:hypothetical protein
MQPHGWPFELFIALRYLLARRSGIISLISPSPSSA